MFATMAEPEGFHDVVFAPFRLSPKRAAAARLILEFRRNGRSDDEIAGFAKRIQEFDLREAFTRELRTLKANPRV